MKLSIYSLREILFQGNAVSLNCKTMVGEITILDNHETYVGVLTEGLAKIIDEEKKEHFFSIKDGFIQVNKNNEVRCIVSSIE